MAEASDPNAPSPVAEAAGSASKGAPPKQGGLRKESIWEVYYPSHISGDMRAIPVASFPMIIYFWPSLITFLFCGLMQWADWIAPTTLGWIATCSLAFNLMIIVTDLSQKKFVIFILSIALVGLLLYISQLRDLPIVSHIGNWVSGIEFTYSTHVYFAIAAFLWLFFFLGMIQPRFDYWLFEPNEFTHYIQPWGRDQSVPRSGSTVTREVPDVLELLLTFGGGTLVIRRENQVVARIEHVPFLHRRMKAIEGMLGVTRVQATN